MVQGAPGGLRGQRHSAIDRADESNPVRNSRRGTRRLRISPTKQQRCDAMEEVYAAYVASTLARDVSPDEVKAATAAAAFLSAHCGWKAVRGFDGYDQNGVPRILPP